MAPVKILACLEQHSATGIISFMYVYNLENNSFVKYFKNLHPMEKTKGEK